MARYDNQKTFTLDDDQVVVIIGSGAGGGTLANELAQKGIDVVLLEAGALHTSAQFIANEWPSFDQLAWLDKRIATGGWRLTRDFPGLPAWTCKTVGGTTVHWAGASLRFQPHEFKAHTTYGDLVGATLMDWPIDYADLKPYYDKAEWKLRVTRTNDLPGLPGNNNFKVMYAGASKVGYKQCDTGHMAINSIVGDERGFCQQRGFCFQGCTTEAKWSTLFTEIPRALATGHCELRPQSMVARIEHDDAGRVTGVVYFDKDGREQRQKARAVAVACNAIESARLLLNSESSRFPNGLANGSDQVGRNYMAHLTASVFATFDKPVDWYRGTVMAGIVEDEKIHKPERGFAGGFHFETISLGLPFTAAFIDPGAWGQDFAEAMDNYRYMAGMWIVGEDMPQASNRVTLHDKEKDQHGIPIPVVSYTDHANDEAMREYAFKQGAAIYEAAGANKIYRVPPYPSTHNMGTCRMSAKPESGVCNAHGQTHEIANLFISDGSQYTTSAAENPTLTIVSLAIRQADYIAAQMKEKAI